MATPDQHSLPYRLLILSVVIAMSAYLLLSLWAGKEEVLAAFARIGWGGLLIALALSLVNYGLRFVRWQGYLNALGFRVPPITNLRIYLGGFALTTTPGKAGEMIRSLFLKRLGVPWSQSFAAFFSERLSDLLAMFLLALPGMMLLDPRLSSFFILVAVLLVVAVFACTQESVTCRLLNKVQNHSGRIMLLLRNLFVTLLAAQRCYRLRCFLPATLLSLLAWAAEALAFYLVLRWLGFDQGFIFAAVVYSVAVLVGALSFLPGGIGGTEAAMVALLLWKGMPDADAVAATVIIRLTTLWFSVALGIGCLVRERITDDG